jgi:MFS family permease
MRTRLSLFFGIFTVMALSNAIVPVLPDYAEESVVQGAIYAAYFLGAFATTLLGGILSDRYGRVPLVRLGFGITVASGLLLSVLTSPVPVIAVRLLEGIGGGLFVASSLSWVNSLPDHQRMSGWFMAFLNAGLVGGLVFAGWLAALFPGPANGILFFTGLTMIPAAVSFLIHEPPTATPRKDPPAALIGMVSDYRWLWYSSIVLIGITGVVTSLYPKFSGSSPDNVGIWISLMSIATILAVLASSRLSLPPVPAIRGSALLMVVAVMVTFYSPLGFVVLGFLSGLVMIVQMSFLSGIKDHQGIAMGLFSTTSYLGMTILPVMAGMIADSAGFFYAFCATALVAITVFFTIGRCRCPPRTTIKGTEG